MVVTDSPNKKIHFLISPLYFLRVIQTVQLTGIKKSLALKKYYFHTPGSKTLS